MNWNWKSFLYRWLREGLQGAFGAMALMFTAGLINPSNWFGVLDILNKIAIAGAFGFISGLVSAGSKYLRLENLE
jgi:hypothetical protein